MDNGALENGSWHVLGRAAFARENDMPYGDFGYRHIGYFNGIENVEKVIAHLLERGFLEYQRDKMGLHSWAITSAGLKEFERLRNPPDERAELDREIAALEVRLIDLKARRYRLMMDAATEHSEPTDPQITRLIGDDFQNGE